MIDAKASTTATTASDGAVDASQFAVDDKKLTELMNDLRAIGVDQLNMPIPVVAIIGSQSAGKSSVVNAISGVTFPRASGTCTRCPMECRMITTIGGVWSCQIKIRREIDDETGRAIHSDQAEVPFGPLINDPRAVEEMLRRAQLAVLNPSVPSTKFISLDVNTIEVGNPPLGSTKQYSFTQNLVILEISGPSVLNLTFIDLPGIIQSAREGEDKNSPQIIKDLSLKYITKESTIILLAVSMETEFENQEAPKFAKEYDPEGKRTIGLLTKPDVVRPTTFRQWLPIIRNEREALTHSWHVVKNPDVDDGCSAPTAESTRLQERRFFEDFPQHPQWKELGPGYSDRLGIPSLTSKLSQVLCLRNRESLPAIRQIIFAGQAETEGKLAHFRPAPKGDPTIIVLSAITSFVADCRESLGGVPSAGRDGFAQARNRIWRALRVGIRSSAPIFRPFPKDGLDDAPEFEEPSFLLDALTVEERSSTVADILEMDLDDVKTFEQNAITNELPGNVPFDVKRTLMIRSMRSWKNFTNVCLDDVSHLLKKFIETIIDKHFGYFRVGLFNDSVKGVVFKLLEELHIDAQETLALFRELDDAVYTQNDHYLSSYKENFLAHFCNQRDQSVGKKAELDEDEIDNIRRTFASLNLRVKDKDIEAMISRIVQVVDPDEYQPILVIMAEVRAYYQVAQKRTIDNIPRAIQNRLVDAFTIRIQGAILAELQPSGEGSVERCARFLQEAPDVVHKREELLAKKSKLQAAAFKISTF